MARWAIQCKAISTIELLYDIRKLELGGLDVNMLILLQSKYPDLPKKVIKRKYQKLKHLGLAESKIIGQEGLTEKGFAELEKIGVVR